MVGFRQLEGGAYNVVINPLKHICGYTADMLNTIATYLSGQNIVVEGFKDGIFNGRDISLIQHIETHISGINEALSAANLENILLEDIPNFGMFGNPTALAVEPGDNIWSLLLLIPLLNLGFTLLSMWVSRKLTFQPMQDQQMQQGNMKFMNIFMAGMTAFIAFGVPAAIGIYWMFIAFWKLTLRYDRFAQYGQKPSNLALWMLICNFIPYIGMLGSLVLGIIWMQQMKNIALAFPRVG